jgi:hypothetical protein
MPRIRVFLCTYRRPRLLRRALAGLLAQTFTDWTCELHNDAPDDDTPRAILDELAPADPRFSYVAHEKNWGAVATFNHAYSGGPEPFASLLEDDNWWEPTFLASALRALEHNPAASLVWANMKLWQEKSDGTWIDTGSTIWAQPNKSDEPVITFHPPELLQAFDALHSNGAMVFRPHTFRPKQVSPALPFSIIEPARERAATGPLLLLTAPLAHFACTLATARDDDPARWLQAKLLVAASFFQNVSVPLAAYAAMWTQRRAQRPRDTGIFFCLALALRDPSLLRPAQWGDWIHFLLSAARHPLRLARGLSFRRDQPEAWAWFVAQTRAHGARPVHATVLAKHPP